MTFRHLGFVPILVPAMVLAGLLACGRRSQPAAGQPSAPPPAPVASATPPAAPAATAPPPPAATAPPPPVPARPAPAQASVPLLEVPARTTIKVVLGRGLATDRDHAGDPWEGTLAEPVRVGGRLAWAKGAPVAGVVTQSEPAGRLKGGQGGLGLRVRTVAGAAVETGVYRVAGAKRATRNTEIIGGGAALGALVGVLTGHGHQAGHALGGAALGAAAGTAVAAGTADTAIRIPAGRVVSFTLTAPRRVNPR